MQYEFKIRFNTEHLKSPGLYWRVLINDSEKLVADIKINNIPVTTVTHVLPNGEKKWSITCKSDYYQISENLVMEIRPMTN